MTSHLFEFFSPAVIRAKARLGFIAREARSCKRCGKKIPRDSRYYMEVLRISARVQRTTRLCPMCVLAVEAA